LGRINSGRKFGWSKTNTSAATHKSDQSTGNDYDFLSHAIGLSNEYANTDKEKIIEKGESERGFIGSNRQYGALGVSILTLINIHPFWTPARRLLIV